MAAAKSAVGVATKETSSRHPSCGLRDHPVKESLARTQVRILATCTDTCQQVCEKQMRSKVGYDLLV